MHLKRWSYANGKGITVWHNAYQAIIGISHRTSWSNVAKAKAWSDKSRIYGNTNFVEDRKYLHVEALFHAFLKENTLPQLCQHHVGFQMVLL